MKFDKMLKLMMKVYKELESHTEMCIVQINPSDALEFNFEGKEVYGTSYMIGRIQSDPSVCKGDVRIVESIGPKKYIKIHTLKEIQGE